MKNNALSQHFNYKTLILYAIPTVIMMIFMSAYMIVDGVFVATFVNENALSAVNIVMPIISFSTAVGLMFATGGNAVVAKLMGEGKEHESRRFFTTLYIVCITLGIILSILSNVFSEQLLSFLGASEILYPYAYDYLLCFIPFITSSFLQIFTQCFFVTAGKPMIGFLACLTGGVTNIILDYVLIVICDLGIIGAGLATGIGFSIPAIFGLIYFIFARKSTLHFVKPILDFKNLLKSIYNGMSEFVNNIAISITTLLFNVILLEIAGEDGVAAISVILYIQMIQLAVYMGYSFGVSPIISYKYGENNYNQLNSIIKFSVKLISIISVIIVVCSLVFAEFAVSIFISPDSSTYELTVVGFRIFSFAYLFMGLNIFTSSVFTALSNGKVSAVLSFTRSLVFIVLVMLTLPEILEILGVWLAVPIAEMLSLILCIYYYKKYKSIYLLGELK